jgi:hypothetical protein
MNLGRYFLGWLMGFQVFDLVIISCCSIIKFTLF